MAAADEQTYTFVDDLAKSVPELAALVRKAAKGKWTAQRFADAVQTTNWWKHNSDTAKKMIDIEKTDPSEYRQEINNAQAHVKQIAAAQGVNLSASQISSLATADLFQGLDDATLTSQIGALYTGQPASGPSGAGGNAVQLTQQIQQLASQYGVPVTTSWVNGEVRTALTNGTGAEGAQSALSQMAASTYPALAAQLAAGQTTEQIAQPYIASMSQILEIPDSGITLQDPTIQKALQQVQIQQGSSGAAGAAGASGKKLGSNGVPVPISSSFHLSGSDTSSQSAVPTQPGSMMTLHDFQNMLRSDPRWQETDNAKSSAYSMLHQLGSAWGFAS